MKNSILIILGLLSLIPLSVHGSTSSPVADDSNIKVYVLNCGHLDINDMSMFSDTGDYDGKAGAVSDSCFLIRHPKGLLLWDTGLPDRLTTSPMKMHVFQMTRIKTVTEQLEALGLKASDIQYVAFSHLHFDHSGNAGLFRRATWLLQKKELDAALSNPMQHKMDPDFFSVAKTAKKNLLTGDFDVFSDGRVKILSTPGHTPGHQSLLIRLKDTGNVIISGDLYHTKDNREAGRVPVMNASRAETLASMDRIEKMAKLLKAKVIIQHEIQDFDHLPKIPSYLQ